jgi:hypothetical protein
MNFLILLADILTDIPWAQFGLAGVTFGTLAFILIRVFKNSVDKEFAEEARKELLVEIERREQRFVNLQEKTLETVNESALAMQRLADLVKDFSEKDDNDK